MADVAAAYAALTIVGCVFLICCAAVYTIPRHRKAGIAVIVFLTVIAAAHVALLVDAVVAVRQ